MTFSDTNNPITQSCPLKTSWLLEIRFTHIPSWTAFLIATGEQFTGFFLLITELLLHRVVVEVETLVLHHGHPAPARHRAGGERDLGPGV